MDKSDFKLDDIPNASKWLHFHNRFVQLGSILQQNHVQRSNVHVLDQMASKVALFHNIPGVLKAHCRHNTFDPSLPIHLKINIFNFVKRHRKLTKTLGISATFIAIGWQIFDQIAHSCVAATLATSITWPWHFLATLKFRFGYYFHSTADFLIRDRELRFKIGRTYISIDPNSCVYFR